MSVRVGNHGCEKNGNDVMTQRMSEAIVGKGR